MNLVSNYNSLHHLYYLGHFRELHKFFSPVTKTMDRDNEVKNNNKVERSHEHLWLHVAL